MTNFHEVQSTCDIAPGSRGGPERRTDVVTMRSGFEERFDMGAVAPALERGLWPAR